MHICKHPLATVTHTHEASPGCFSSASAPLTGSNPPHKFIYNKNSTDYCRCCSCYGGDGGIRIIEKSFHSVDNTQNRHFQAYILYKISSVSSLFLLLTTSIVVKTVVNIPNDSVHKCVFVDYIAI